MSRNNQEEQRRSTRNSMDNASLRSFSSDSTLASSSLLTQTRDEEKEPCISHQNDGLLFTTRPTSTSWRRAPLTARWVTSNVLRTLYSLLIVSVPSFLFQRQSARRLHPTSYLDGLRGVAAFIVLMDHFVLNWYFELRHGYLDSPEDSNLLQLPFIRLLFAGRASVGVFFVISGFVLTYKSLRQIRAGESSSVLDTLASAVFRRGMRLYLPIFFGTSISMLLAYNSYYTPTPHRNELIPPTFPTFYEEAYDWAVRTYELIFPFRNIDPNNPYGPAYNGHLWTIPLEFYGSIVVFVTTLGLSRVRSSIRMTFVAGSACCSLERGRWDLWLFLGGMFLAELSLSADAKTSTQSLPIHSATSVSSSPFIFFSTVGMSSTPNIRILLKLVNLVHMLFLRLYLLIQTLLQLLKTPINLLLLTTSLFLLSYAGESPTPGSYHLFLNNYTPSIWPRIFLGAEHFWLAIGAVLLVFALSRSSSLQKPFIHPLAQYLGDISYALYIVHGPVLFTLGTWLQERWTGQVGRSEWVDNGEGGFTENIVRGECDGARYFKAFVAAGIINLVVVVWWADLFWRGVDGRCVRWGRWLEGLASARN